MTIIKAQIHRANTDYECAECGKPIGACSEYMYIYGMAQWNEKPTGIRMHIGCVEEDFGYITSPRDTRHIVDALDRYYGGSWIIKNIFCSR